LFTYPSEDYNSERTTTEDEGARERSRPRRRRARPLIVRTPTVPLTPSRHYRTVAAAAAAIAAAAGATTASREDGDEKERAKEKYNEKNPI